MCRTTVWFSPTLAAQLVGSRWTRRPAHHRRRSDHRCYGASDRRQWPPGHTSDKKTVVDPFRLDPQWKEERGRKRQQLLEATEKGFTLVANWRQLARRKSSRCR